MHYALSIGRPTKISLDDIKRVMLIHSTAEKILFWSPTQTCIKDAKSKNIRRSRTTVSEIDEVSVFPLLCILLYLRKFQK